MQLQDFHWSLQPKDLEHEKFTLQNKFNPRMKSLLNDKDEQLSHANRLQGQDIIYAATKRRVRNPRLD